MNLYSSRRRFFAAGMALPAAALARPAVAPPAGAPPAPLKDTGPALTYGTLGKTGLKPTRVAFGCMITSDQTVIERAVDAGINYFDTARGYQSGNNERMVGAAIKPKRKDLILSSKTPSTTKELALKDLETSLRELGTDYLDIWYLHAKSKPEQITEDLLEAQRIAKRDGKVRFVGISTHAGQAELVPAVLAARHFDVLLTSYNFTMEPAMEGLLSSARNAGLGIVAMKVMAGGFRRIKQGDPLYPKFERDGAMLAMLKWVLRNRNVDTTIPSITDLDQLDQNLRAMSERFTPADEKLLAERLDYLKPLYCRMCGKCEASCRHGLPVPDLVRYVSYAEGYGQFALGRANYLELPPEHRAVECARCDGCTVTCPNGVRVAERVSRARELFG
jgi:hypothetical protein